MKRVMVRVWSSVRPFPADERGQAATEYVLVIGLISIPLYLAFKLVFEIFLHDFIAAVITNFTRG